METTCQQTELEILSDAFAALEAVTRRQYAILELLARIVPAVLLAAMSDTDKLAMPLLVERAMWYYETSDVQRRA